MQMPKPQALDHKDQPAHDQKILPQAISKQPTNPRNNHRNPSIGYPATERASTHLRDPCELHGLNLDPGNPNPHPPAGAPFQFAVPPEAGPPLPVDVCHDQFARSPGRDSRALRARSAAWARKEKADG
jgi:hypothetical protein